MFQTVHFRANGQTYAADGRQLRALRDTDPEGFLAWLLDTRAFLDAAFLPVVLHPDELVLLHAWVREQRAALPPIALPAAGGPVRDRPALLAFLDGLLPWLAARRRLNEAICEQSEDPDDPGALAGLRHAQRAFAHAALGLPAAFREPAARAARTWADFVDRSWVHGLNVPPPLPPGAAGGTQS